MANSKHLAIIKEGVPAWNVWRQRIRADSRTSSERPELPDLQDADLRFHMLEHADLSQVNLSGANLFGAHLLFANLQGANLRGADLREADLGNAILRDTVLDGADLRDAQLYGADLGGSRLIGTRLDRATFGRTNVGSVDLSLAHGLESVEHAAPSTIGIETIHKSRGITHEILEAFLLASGIPRPFIQPVLNLVRGVAPAYHSCFISHSTKDKDFCDRLFDDLRRSGIRCWYFPESACFGKSVWGEIDHEINEFDKLILVCSRNSLRSRPVLREVTRALTREDREQREVLFPIRIDNYMFVEWEHPLREDVTSRVVGDFCDWRDSGKYRESFGRLLESLSALGR